MEREGEDILHRKLIASFEDKDIFVAALLVF